MKPFVEKPVSGEDYNIYLYYPKDHGGRSHKLFKKVGSKSSERDESCTIPRAILKDSSSYIYEELPQADNSEGVKVYAFGWENCHVETRKSPVGDMVRRITHGKEVWDVALLTKEEVSLAARIVTAFKQRNYSFDALRIEGKSFVMDVNG